MSILVNNITEDELLNPLNLELIINETAKALIKNKALYMTESSRIQILNEYGKNAYIIPNEMKLPIIDPIVGDYDCSLLYAARLRTRLMESYDPSMSIYKDKADKIFNECKCNKSVKINIVNHSESYELLELIDILNLKEIVGFQSILENNNDEFSNDISIGPDELEQMDEDTRETD